MIGNGQAYISAVRGIHNQNTTYIAKMRIASWGTACHVVTAGFFQYGCPTSGTVLPPFPPHQSLDVFVFATMSVRRVFDGFEAVLAPPVPAFL